METNSNHSTNDGTKTAEKMLNDSSKQIMDFYTTQLNVATSFYKNLFDSFSTGNKGWNNTPDFSNGFSNNHLTKTFTMPFGGFSNNFSNPFLQPFNDFYKQMADTNTAMFTNLTTGLKGNTDMSEFSKKIQDTINTQIEASKTILKNTTEAYTKRLDFSLENNKKAIEEMNNQFNTIVKQNQKLWSDLISSTEAPTKNEEKIVKDSISPEIKKRTTAQQMNYRITKFNQI